MAKKLAFAPLKSLIYSEEINRKSLMSVHPSSIKFAGGRTVGESRFNNTDISTVDSTLKNEKELMSNAQARRNIIRLRKTEIDHDIMQSKLTKVAKW
jgi:hypothetical protein